MAFKNMRYGNENVEASDNAFRWGIKNNFNIKDYEDEINEMIDDKMRYAIIRVETTVRKIKVGKFLWFPVYQKIPVYRLVYIAPLTTSKISYEEFLSYEEIFKRLTSKPIYFDDVMFPKCVRVNDFIDLGFPITIRYEDGEE